MSSGIYNIIHKYYQHSCALGKMAIPSILLIKVNEILENQEPRSWLNFISDLQK